MVYVLKLYTYIANRFINPNMNIYEIIIEPIKRLVFYLFYINTEIDPSEAQQNSLFIIDDFICEKQYFIRSYCIMGCQKRVHC